MGKKKARPFGQAQQKGASETDAPSESIKNLYLGFLSHLGEAVAAVNRTIALGLKGHAGLAAASCAGSGEVLTGTTGSILASVTAGLAALGLVLEAALSVELLLTGGEHELVAALFAH